jgi:hypothetical protein
VLDTYCLCSGSALRPAPEFVALPYRRLQRLQLLQQSPAQFEFPVIADRAFFPDMVDLNMHTKHERNGLGIWRGMTFRGKGIHAHIRSGITATCSSRFPPRMLTDSLTKSGNQSDVHRPNSARQSPVQRKMKKISLPIPCRVRVDLRAPSKRRLTRCPTVHCLNNSIPFDL